MRRGILVEHVLVSNTQQSVSGHKGSRGWRASSTEDPGNWMKVSGPSSQHVLRPLTSCEPFSRSARPHRPAQSQSHLARRGFRHPRMLWQCMATHSRHDREVTAWHGHTLFRLQARWTSEFLRVTDVADCGRLWQCLCSAATGPVPLTSWISSPRLPGSPSSRHLALTVQGYSRCWQPNTVCRC